MPLTEIQKRAWNEVYEKIEIMINLLKTAKKQLDACLESDDDD